MSIVFPFLNDDELLYQLRCGADLSSNYTEPERPFTHNEVIPAYLVHINGSCNYFVDELVIKRLLKLEFIELSTTMPTHQNYKLTESGLLYSFFGDCRR